MIGKEEISQKKLVEILDDFLNSSKTIELNIASTVTEANNEIEIILRELLVYLSTTSKNLEKIQDKVENLSSEIHVVDNIHEDVKQAREQLSSIPKEINNTISNSIPKIIDEFKTINQSSISLMNAIGSYVKSIYVVTKNVDTFTKNQKEDIKEIKTTLEELSNQVKKTNITVERNQNNLMSVIKDLLTINNTSKANELVVEKEKVKVEEAKVKVKEVTAQASSDAVKAKYQLIGKIAALILGSGGILYIVVEAAIKIFTK